MIVLTIWLTVLGTVLVLYFRKVYSKFSGSEVKCFSVIPVLGNMANMLFQKRHFAEDLQDLYDSFPGERFVGRYEFTKDIIVIRDIELVKKITVKDFEYFIDHRTVFDSECDPFVTRNLFLLKGDEWKFMRSTLSPAFTSSKIRQMMPFMVEIADQLTQSLNTKFGAMNDSYVDIDCKDLIARYTNDVIASCAFGLKVNSHQDENNEFYANGKKATTFKFRQLFVMFCLVMFPKLMKAMKISLFPKSIKQFFTNLVLDTMKDREEHQIVRPDMINLLMQIRKDWNDDDLVAQAFLFFAAGFETVSTASSFLLYEMAMHPEIQEKLAEEIKQHDRKHNGNLDFHSIQTMTYLDMVVSETLRLWPPSIVLDRICMRDYNIGKANENCRKDFIVRKGTGIVIPVYAIHRDAQIFPNPKEFDPERFSEDNKQKIKPFAYMPFGVGPRNCIGSRFALCEIKVLVYSILKDMIVSPNEKTCIPAKLATESFNIQLKGGHWLGFRRRN